MMHPSPLGSQLQSYLLGSIYRRRKVSRARNQEEENNDSSQITQPWKLNSTYDNGASTWQSSGLRISPSSIANDQDGYCRGNRKLRL
uniref:Uncharacterized protein n=1 Tax=Cannabis sativa TaxID=3483 RepID=A0A803P9A2_CANSA